jgi:very-short-patch-repair endonuclease
MDARGLHGLAATQKWLLKQEQVLEHLSWDQLKHALRRDELVTVFPRVYKPWGAPEWWEQRLLAACWSFDAVGSHRSSARVHRLNGVPAVRLELTVPWPRQVRAQGVLVHSSKLLLPEFVTEVDGIPVTAPDRACLELSAVCSATPLEKAWESAKVAGLVDAESLQRTAIRMQARGRRRMQTVWALLERWDPSLDMKDLDLQMRTWQWMVADETEPLPEIEFWVVINGERYRLDFAWPRLKVCVECDGWEYHGLRRKFRSDRDKTTELELAGWLVVLVTSDMSREVVLDRIRRALALRSGPTFLR